MHAARICVVIPVFNDWVALQRLLRELEIAFDQTGVVLDVIVVNDASAPSYSGALLGDFGRDIFGDVMVVDLRANVGHQLAIAAGLHYAQDNRSFDAVIIMDADGEDDPSDAVRLVERWRREEDKLVVAARSERSENAAFKSFYRLYRLVFRAMTGQSISFGNFSLIPATALPAVLSRPELFQHFAATLLRTRLPIVFVPTRRGLRYAGKSQMNVPSLVLHALGALSVFSDILFSRILIATAFIGAVCGLGMIVVVILKLFTTYALPIWATTVTSFLTLLAAQAIVLILCTGFLLLTSRASSLLTSLESTKIVKDVRVAHKRPEHNAVRSA
jgi:glycosyltransferase involved in cell wall biosynthesis